MLEPACISQMEHKLAAHEGKTASQHQYAIVHSQPGAPTVPMQTTSSGMRMHTWKAEFNGSGKGDVESHGEVQGGGYESG